MPQFIDTPPNAANFVESLRKYGYDFSSALADIFDNSISADCSNIDITFLPNKNWLTIKDDGKGMDQSGLEIAMQLGSGDPLESRNKKDLGRFGCGLKTASFSQSRKLIVLSKQNKKYTGAEWDLDVIKDSNEWKLGILSSKEVETCIKKFGDIGSKTGTLVIWDKIDQMKGAADQNQKIDEAKEHLRLTFHRFMDKTFDKKGLTINVNGDELKPLDPFLSGKSNKTPQQKIPIKEGSNQCILLEGYTLPALNKLSQTQKTDIELKNDLNQAQGFYIYRGNRLIKYGGWLGLKKYQALTNLSRVKVDVPNSIDEEWNTDIKKTSMDPPPRVMDSLRKLLDKFHDPSKKIYKKRASDKLKDVEIWERYEQQKDLNKPDLSVSFEVNKKSDRYKKMFDKLDKKNQKIFIEFINYLEDELPAQQISIDVIDGKID
jgi:hypothetical protein